MLGFYRNCGIKKAPTDVRNFSANVKAVLTELIQF
jgi:hypothetical protein